MHTAHNDNYNGTEPYCEGGNFNVIVADISPLIARNIASFYANKDQPWADGMARRLRAAANDNGAGGRRTLYAARTA
ncbi:hypothetical protein LB559_09045 [Mesorhizobium sp. BR1-1-3]|uniref:hypothetical protein n=1 Tax=Mesorhizobium sp. BR1-1-3 TaxID=2876651 RepID=UPI001CD1442A|nr:hypothetical protein [Mesorhizobium sp. BR1-1-3]MBZ9888084.1 hypothetical protein [Mesorhizobium sp. BR1-1-3]